MLKLNIQMFAQTDGTIVIATEIDTKNFDAQIDYIQEKMLDIEEKLKKADMGYEVGDVQKLEAEYERLGNQLVGLKQKQDKYNESIKKAQLVGFDKIKSSVDDIGKSVQKATKKITKWALAIFGIRSAYMLVRNAINTISGNDEQLKADIDYMKNALAYAIEPLVRGIVNLAKQLMFYIGYIVKAWTGKNIFANANKSLAGANKQAKELSKTMAGFDEMNVVGSNSSTGSSGGATPSFDLSSQENIEPPKWLKWIADHKEEVIAGLGGIAAALGAVKFNFLDLEKLGKSEFFTKLAGIGLIVGGIIYTIEELITYIKDPSWEKFGGIITGIGVALLGVALIIGGWPVAIAGAIVSVLGIIAKFWDKIENFLENLKNKIFDVGDKIMSWINDKLGVFGVIINEVIGTLVGVLTNTIDLIKSLLGGIFNFLRSILDSVIMLFKGDFKGALSTILKGIGNLFIDVINTIISALNLITSPIRALIVAIGKVTGRGWTMENIQIPKIPRLAKGGIINNPGRGVALGGERGAEGVIPLTDSQQMQMLGEAIGKYITINANIVNTMNGRIISKELIQIQNESNFAYNR